MKRFLFVFVLMLGFAGVSFAQTQQWTAGTSAENINIDMSAVTVDDHIESFTIRVSGSIDEGWTADSWLITSGITGSSYSGGPIASPGNVSLVIEGGGTVDPIDAMTYYVTLKGPEYNVYLAVELYLDYSTGKFILHTN